MRAQNDRRSRGRPPHDRGLHPADPHRVQSSERLIQEERLWGDLLSSQPMCFNLFGELAADLALATRTARAWWPGRVAQVTEV